MKKGLEFIGPMETLRFNVIALGPDVSDKIREKLMKIKGLTVLNHQRKRYRAERPVTVAKGPRGRWGGLQ